jgi:hypothetical protein
MAQKTNVDFGEVEKVLKELEKELKQCKGVQVGWLENEMTLDRDRTPTQTKQGEVALKLNFGSPEERIPPRPFLTNATSNKYDIYNRRMKALFDKEGSFQETAIQFGETVRNDIQKEIDSNIPPPNSPITIEKKGGSSHTLIDTGHMRNSIQVQIMKASDE